MGTGFWIFYITFQVLLLVFLVVLVVKLFKIKLPDGFKEKVLKILGDLKIGQKLGAVKENLSGAVKWPSPKRQTYTAPVTTSSPKRTTKPIEKTPTQPMMKQMQSVTPQPDQPKRRSYQSEKKSKKAVGIQTGFISLFFDSFDNITIIPYAKDKKGKGKALDRIITLRHPYRAHEIGEALLEAIEASEYATPCKDKELVARLQVKKWEEFLAGKRYIAVKVDDVYGIVMNTTTKMPDGTYRFNCPDGLEKVMKKDVSCKEIGEAVLTLLLHCKNYSIAL